MAEVRSVTQMAFDAICDQAIGSDEAYEYIIHNDNFKSLSDVLKETMVSAGVCQNGDDTSVFINKLNELLCKQADDCKKVNSIPLHKIKRWMTGETKSIRDRLNAIEICFVLGLDAEQSKTFLNKCGFCGFNVRDADDSIYLYCICHKRPLSSAVKLKLLYEEDIPSEHEGTSMPESRNFHNGQTTMIMRRDILGDWEDDDKFLESFLFMHKQDFIGYSKNAVMAYKILKNIAFLTVFINEVKMSEAVNVAHINRINNNPDPGKTVEDKRSDIRDYKKEVGGIPISIAVRSALRKYTDEKSVLYEVNKALKEDMSNTADVLKMIQNIAITSTNPAIQDEIMVFLKDVKKDEGFMKLTLLSICGDDGRIRRLNYNNHSILKDTVLKEFPNGRSFAKFEKDPSIMYNGKVTRKAIILMYFIIYAYELPVFLDTPDYVSQTFNHIAEAMHIPNDEYSDKDFSKMGYDEFYDSMNLILAHCGLPELYYADQYDWLILKSIIAIIQQEYKSGSDAIAFFDEVIDNSFEDDED